MKKKHVSIIFVTAVSLLGITAGCVETSIFTSANKKAKGDAPQDSFTIVLDKDNHAITEYGSGSVNAVTAHGNLIHVDYTLTSETTDAWAKVANGGVIKNAYDSTTYNNQLSGLTSIKVSFSGGSALSLSYGWAESVSSAKYARAGYKLSSGEVFNFGAECPSYFALKATAETVITRVELTYSCVKEVEQDVFKIGSYDDLVNYAKLVNGGITGLNAELTNNIDASASSTDGGFIQIGRSGYSGTFDGNGYTITNLTLKEYSGVDFPYNGFISRGGGAKGFTVKDLDIELFLTETNANNGRNGLLVAQSWDGAKISDVIVRGSLSSINSDIAGFIGWVESGSAVGNVIENCANYATITTTKTTGRAGGFVGFGYKPTKEGVTHLTISNCDNYGNVTAPQFVGGIVGGTETLSGLTTSKVLAISECKNYGTLNATSNYAGGVIGIARANGTAPLSTIDKCENWGSVSSGGFAGGIAALLRGTSVTNSFVSAGNPSRIIRIKNTALTSANYLKDYRMIGQQTLTNASSPYYYAGTDISAEKKVYGWLIAQLDNVNNAYVDDTNWCGWYGDGSDHTGFAGGDGTAANPYQIERASQYLYLRNLLNSDDTYASYGDKNYVLTKNIDFDYVPENANSRNLAFGTGAANTQAHAFSGTFDGQGYSINNFGFIKASDVTALFCYTINATFKDVSLVNPYILSGKSDGTAYFARSGGFSGRAQATKFNNVSVVGGSIIGKQEVGGIAGISIDNGSEFVDCFNSAEVSAIGASSVGGFVGIINNGAQTVANCVNEGNVSTTAKFAGGLIGQLMSGGAGVYTISECSNNGDVTGGEGVGGIVGSLSNGSSGSIMELCTNNGDITGTDYAIGGILGESGTAGLVAIDKCQNNGTITNLATASSGFVGKFTGGIAGLPRAYTGNAITNCINNGDVEGKVSVGGIVGDCRVNITSCQCLASAKVRNTALGEWTTFEDAVKVDANIFIYGTYTSGTVSLCSLLTENPKSIVYPFQMGSMQD